MKMLENLSLFGLFSSLYHSVFLCFLPSRPSWPRCLQEFRRVHRRVSVSTRTNRTAGIQLKESTSKGNLLDQRERERGGESQQVYKRETEV